MRPADLWTWLFILVGVLLLAYAAYGYAVLPGIEVILMIGLGAVLLVLGLRAAVLGRKA